MVGEDAADIRLESFGVPGAVPASKPLPKEAGVQ